MKTPKTTEEMIEEWDELIKVSTKLELRQWLQSTLTQLANSIHEQSALEAEGRKESVRDCGRCNNCETAVSTCEIIIDANGFNKACEADATYHRSKVIE